MGKSHGERGRGTINTLLRKPKAVAALVLGIAIGATQFPVASPVANLVMAGSTRSAQAPASVGPTSQSTSQAQTATINPVGRTTAAAAHAEGKATPAQLAAAGKLLEKRPLRGPDPGKLVPAAHGSELGAPIPVGGKPGRAAGTLQTFRNSAPPTAGTASVVDEPSTDQSGKNVFQTGNWHASYSHDNGATFTSLNPFAIFGSGFCCDQVAKYDARRDTMYWLLQYGDHTTIANSPSGSLTSWCSYNLTASVFGFPANYEVDYNDLAVGTNYLYWTVNIFSPSAFVATTLVRLPLDSMSACTAASLSYTNRTDLFTLKVADGSTDVAWAASSLPLPSGAGTSMRVISWPESSATVTTYTMSVAAFTYMSNGTGTCGSADAVVNNWCQRTDGRILGATRANGNLYFTWNARQSGSSRPFPYTRLVIVKEGVSPFVFTQGDIFGTQVARIYMSIAADRAGHIGWVLTWGGGLGATHVFPSIMIGLVDDVTPAWPGSTLTFVGSGGGCLNTADSSFRWGDYNTARGWPSGTGLWTVTSFYRNENSSVSCGSAASVNVRNIVFGRSRSLPTYTRFGGS
ncbi:MAG: hypothetical protein JWM05_206 [Acidimicrobiales bacterium]|nr:hypothetical protein [Acidimicrobiales bacterium]